MPQKQGGAYAFGIRIYPIREDNRSSSSGGSNSEYEIWRRWEDCLRFQDNFEIEYGRMSRMKRKRLMAGKGVKKNGVYVQKDHASSFESLPPGPDPSSVAKSVHEHVPKLTKKGTLFSASQATIDQRYRELKACLDGFFQENAPMLIQELRECRKVIDFFGFWQRDFDLASKQQKDKNPEKQPRHSISSSVFSTYFSTSNNNLTTTEATLVNPPAVTKKSSDKHLAPLKSHSSKSFLSSNFSTKASSFTSSDDDLYPRRGSGGSPNSSLGPPSPPSNLHIPSPYIVPHDIPTTFSHNPMESVPEDEEFVVSSSGMSIARSMSASPTSEAHNNIAHNSFSQTSLDEDDTSTDKSFNRFSWQTTTSTATINPATYLADLNTDLTLPKASGETYDFPRGSVASFASFKTDNSADAIIPLSPQSEHRRSPSADSGQTRTPFNPESTLAEQEGDDLLDVFFNETTLKSGLGCPTSPTPESRPGTPVGELPSSLSVFGSRSGSMRNHRIRSRSSSVGDFTSSDSSSILGDSSIHIKVVHHSDIILLRVPRNISLKELRAKVYNKFKEQPGVPLSESFVIAFLPPAPIDYTKPRSRSSSMSAAGFPDLAQMRFMTSQHEWEYIVATNGRAKLTLRAIGDQSI